MSNSKKMSKSVKAALIGGIILSLGSIIAALIQVDSKDRLKSFNNYTGQSLEGEVSEYHENGERKLSRLFFGNGMNKKIIQEIHFDNKGKKSREWKKFWNKKYDSKTKTYLTESEEFKVDIFFESDKWKKISLLNVYEDNMLFEIEKCLNKTHVNTALYIGDVKFRLEAEYKNSKLDGKLSYYNWKGKKLCTQNFQEGIPVGNLQIVDQESMMQFLIIMSTYSINENIQDTVKGLLLIKPGSGILE